MDRLDYDSTSLATDYVRDSMRAKGMEPDDVKVNLILGSGLNDFADARLNAKNAGKPSGPVVIPFDEILRQLGEPLLKKGMPGHERRLVIGPMQGLPDNVLVMGQQGREHPYEGISTRRATFWLRIAQLLGAQLLVGSNASGILTPDTLKVPALMLVNSDYDQCDDNPLVGDNDDRFGPRNPDMNDAYSFDMRVLARQIAKELNISLGEGTYMRQKGPNFESPDTTYILRGLLKNMWREGGLQQGERRFRGLPVGAVGMSSTYEMLAAKHASMSKAHPAFKRRTFISVATNNASGLSSVGIGSAPNHNEVQASAAEVHEWFEELISQLIQRSQKSL